VESLSNEEITRSDVIHAKGFNMHNYTYNNQYTPSETEFKRIKVGVKNLDDAVLNLGSLKTAMPGHGYTNKGTIYKALADNNLTELRNISNFFYNMNGIY
jgi:hypothetical protein